MPPLLQPESTFPQDFEQEEHDDAANDPAFGETTADDLTLCSSDELMKRKNALLWLVKPGNGSSKEQLQSYTQKLREIDTLLEGDTTSGVKPQSRLN